MSDHDKASKEKKLLRFIFHILSFFAAVIYVNLFFNRYQQRK